MHKIFCGITDPELNTTGRLQAEALHTHLIKHKQDISDVFSSHLVRAKTTAEIVTQILGLEVNIVHGLHECNFGVLENQKLNEDFHLYFQQWIAGTTPQGAESYEEFFARTATSVNNCLEISSGTPLIVSHGGFYMHLSKHLGFNYLQLDNCELVYISPLEDSKWEITKINNSKLQD